MLLMIRPPLAGDDVGAARLEDLDEVADPLLGRARLDSAVKPTMSAKPTVTWVVCRSSSLRASASTRATAAARWRRQA